MAWQALEMEAAVGRALAFDAGAIYSREFLGRHTIDSIVNQVAKKLISALKAAYPGCWPGEELTFADPRLGPRWLLGWFEKDVHGMKLLAICRSMVTLEWDKRRAAELVKKGEAGAQQLRELNLDIDLKAARLARALLQLRGRNGHFLGLPLVAVMHMMGLSITGGLDALSAFSGTPTRTMLEGNYDTIYQHFVAKIMEEMKNSPNMFAIYLDNFNVQTIGQRLGAGPDRPCMPPPFIRSVPPVELGGGRLCFACVTALPPSHHCARCYMCLSAHLATAAPRRRRQPDGVELGRQPDPSLQRAVHQEERPSGGPGFAIRRGQPVPVRLQRGPVLVDAGGAARRRALPVRGPHLLGQRDAG